MVKGFSLHALMDGEQHYANRRDAGQRLGNKLRSSVSPNAVIMALPRGGVVLGAEVAKMLKVPLGVVLVRKIGHPLFPEFAIGAVAEGGEPIYSDYELSQVNKEWLEQAEANARRLIKKRRGLYFDKNYKPPQIRGNKVILVDDGIATGLTMRAAAESIIKRKPDKLIIAVPVASRESVNVLEHIANEVIVLDDPDNFLDAVGLHYQQFEQVDDEEVKAILKNF